MIQFNDIHNMKDIVSSRIFNDDCRNLTDEQLLIVKCEMQDHGLE